MSKIKKTNKNFKYFLKTSINPIHNNFFFMLVADQSPSSVMSKSYEIIQSTQLREREIHTHVDIYIPIHMHRYTYANLFIFNHLTYNIYKLCH